MKVFKKDIKIQMERSLSPEGDSHCFQRRTKLFIKTISLRRQCMQEKKLRHSVGKAFSIYLIQIKNLGSIFIRKHSCRTLNLYFCSLLEGRGRPSETPYLKKWWLIAGVGWLYLIYNDPVTVKSNQISLHHLEEKTNKSSELIMKMEPL